MASPAPPGAIDEAPVLVDTGVLHIEEMRGPDQLPDKQKKLQVYLKDGDDIAQRSLPAVTGDQVIFRVKEVRSSTSDATEVRDSSSSKQQQLSPPTSPTSTGMGAGSSSGTPRATGPQVAMLGSPQVPVGLSSALGYLHLGQVARVKVPPHLMEHTVTDVMGNLQDADNAASMGTRATQAGQHGSTAGGTQSGSQSDKSSSSQAPGQHTAQATPHSAAALGSTAGGSSAQQSDLQQPQQQQEVASHPIDVIEAATKGATPVHTAHSPQGGQQVGSPGRRRHKLLLHRSPVRTHHETETVTVTTAAVVTSDTVDSSSSDAMPSHSRQYSDPKIIRPKGWGEQQQQQQGSSAVTTSPAAAGTAAGGTPRTSRVAAAAAHAAAAGDDPIRRAVAAAMGKSPSPTAAAPAPPPAAPAPRVTPPTLGSVPEAASARYGTASTAPGSTASIAAGSTSSTSLIAGLDSSNNAFSPINSTMQSARAVSPTVNRSISPGPSSAAGRSMYSSGFGRSDRGPNPERPRSGGSQGIAFTRMSPQPSLEAPLPATPHPSPAVDSAVMSQPAGGGVRALVSRLNQQTGTAGGTAAAGSTGSTGSVGSRSPQPLSPTVQGFRPRSPMAGGFRAVSPPAAAAAGGGTGGNRRLSDGSSRSTTSAAAAAGNRRGSADSYSGSSNAGFYTPSATAGTPFYTPGANTPQSANSDADSTIDGSTVGGTTMSVGGNTISSDSGSVVQGSRQGPPSRSLMTLEGLSPRSATAAGAAGGFDRGSTVGSQVGSSGSTAGLAGAVRSPRPAGLAAMQPQQQQQGVSDRGRVGSTSRRELNLSGTAGGTAVASTTAAGAGSRSPRDSSAVLQAAADKLRSQYPEATAAAAAAETAPDHDTVALHDAAAAEAPSASKGRMPSAAAAATTTTAGRRPTNRLQQQLQQMKQISPEDSGPVSFAKWLPPGAVGDSAAASSSGGRGSDLMAAAAAMAAAEKTGTAATAATAPAAGSSGSDASKVSAEAAAMAAALQPGFDRSVGHSSGRTVTQSTVDSGDGNYNLQNYPTARHNVEGFGSERSSGDGLRAGAAAATSSAVGTAGVGAGSGTAGGSTAVAGAPKIEPAAAAVPAVAVPAKLISPSKAAAAAALSGYTAVEAGAPAAPVVTAVDSTAAVSPKAGKVSPKVGTKGIASAVPELYAPKALQGQQQSVHSDATAAIPITGVALGAVAMEGQYSAGTGTGTVQPVGDSTAASGVYVRPIEHALMPGQHSSSFTQSNSSSVGPACAAKPASATAATAGTELSEVPAGRAPPGEGGSAAGEAADASAPRGDAAGGTADATAGSTAVPSGSAEVVQDDRVEYEVEVLGIIPGHGPLSGQPVLSEAAQQENLTPADVKAAATAAGNAEPQLKPPKPRKGFSGWVRRHLSVNVGAPWRAGKAGAGMLGLRGCFKGGQGVEKQDKLQQEPMYGTSGA